MRVILDLSKSVDKNISEQYDQIKKLKKKQSKIKEVITHYEQELEKAWKKEKKRKVAEQKRKDQEEEKKEKRKNRAWYEQFHWFKASDGTLIVGGKNAQTNELLIKKHAEDDEIVFHTEMAGSPFFVIKENKTPSKQVLQEAADATFTFSRGAKRGLLAGEVFHVQRNQLSKEAEAGEYIAKGAFMVRGKKKQMKGIFNLCVGKDKEETLLLGPQNAVRATAVLKFELTFGNKKKSDLAKALAKELAISVHDELIERLPTGNFSYQKIL